MCLLSNLLILEEINSNVTLVKLTFLQHTNQSVSGQNETKAEILQSATVFQLLPDCVLCLWMCVVNIQRSEFALFLAQQRKWQSSSAMWPGLITVTWPGYVLTAWSGCEIWWDYQ